MKNLGSYTLGDEYVSPKNRLSQLLMQQGGDSSPSHSWQETMGRLSKSLVGAYMGIQDQKQQDDFISTIGKQQPDVYSDKSVPGVLQTDDQLMQHPMMKHAINEIGGGQDDINMAEQTPLGQGLGAGFDQARQGADRVESGANNFSGMLEQLRAQSLEPTVERTLDAKMPQRDFMIKNLQAMPNNTYAKRGLAQALMQGMDQDREAGLEKLARSQKLEDIQNTQRFTSEQNALNRGATLDAATLKAGEPVTAIKEYLQVKQAGLFDGTFEEYKKIGKSDTTVNVGGNAYEKENAGMLVGEHKIARESADNAYRQNMVIAAQRSIPLETGWGAQSKAWGAKFLGALGMANDEALQVANNADQFKSVTMSFLLDKLAAQKGPQTEGDANRALETIASLQNMPDANRFILDLTEALNGQAIEKANFMDSYSMKNGNLIGYRSQWGASDQGKKSIFDSPTMDKWKGRDGTLALKPGQVVDTMPDPSTNKGVTLQGEDGSIFISDGVGWNRQ